MQWYLNIKSETKNVDLVRSFLRNIFHECGFDFALFNKVFLAVSEAVCNAIEHGNKGIAEKNVQIGVFAGSDYIVVTVKDEGIGFEYEMLPDPTTEVNLRKESGRGIYILKNIADSIVFQEHGTKVMIKFLLK